MLKRQPTPFKKIICSVYNNKVVDIELAKIKLMMNSNTLIEIREAYKQLVKFENLR